MDDDKEKMLAFARDFTMGKSALAQSGHWLISYSPNYVAGDTLTIKAIAPDYAVSTVMKMLEEAISQIDKDKYQGKA